MHKQERKKEYLTPAFAYRNEAAVEPIPKYEMQENSLPAEVAYQLIADELNLDGNPSLNLASFVTTWMEPQAQKLARKSMNKNFIDHDEYPQTEEIHNRVINMIARLFHADKNTDGGFLGTATIGSSEAIMLAMLAHKWKWRESRKAAGKPYDKPNLIIGRDVHTCWEKFCLYFDVEAKMVDLRPDCFHLTTPEVEKLVDENTIAVGCVLGSTFTGHIDDVEGINKFLEKVKDEKGWDIPIHVDGASGGFVMPFTRPDFKWDFRLSQVKSINVSNHKFGLVFPGMGTVIFRDSSTVPKDLIFDITYLGGHMPNYSLNFSRGSSMILLQYFNFLRLGKRGYKKLMQNIMENTKFLAEQILAMDRFTLLSNHKHFPVVALKLKSNDNFNEYHLSAKLREYGWIVPAYTLPKNADDICVLRIVIKENFSHDMALKFCSHLKHTMKILDTEKPAEIPRQKVEKVNIKC